MWTYVQVTVTCRGSVDACVHLLSSESCGDAGAGVCRHPEAHDPVLRQLLSAAEVPGGCLLLLGRGWVRHMV